MARVLVWYLIALLHAKAALSGTTTTYFYTINTGTDLSWEEANRVCMTNFGKLVGIPDTATQTYLSNWLPTQGTYDKFYLGIERVDSNWLFYNATTVNFFSWAVNEPGIQDCAVMSAADNYAWKTHDCSGGAGYMCQYDCERDPFWCLHGNVVLNGNTCSCVCDSGWSGSFCDVVDVHIPTKYVKKKGRVSFDAGQTYCNERFSKLPSVTTQQQYDDLLAYLANNIAKRRVYVDLRLVDGSWVDSNGKTPSISKWRVGHPIEGNECVFVLRANNHEWESSTCTLNNKILCEYECYSAKEMWCVHGDVIIVNGKCQCQCWPGALGDYCQDYDYGDALAKTLTFYKIQRSGYLPDNDIPWRSHSALGDQGLDGEDLTGGWYDAGDHIKVTLKVGQYASVLAWAFLEFKDVYVNASLDGEFYEVLKWGMDFIVKAHTKPNELYVHVANPSLDHSYWGPPEAMTMERPSYRINETQPGSDAAGNAASALAAAYMVFTDKGDTAYANLLLEHAKQLYHFAKTYRGEWYNSVPEVGFSGGSYGDELTQAAVWMYRATGNQTYEADAIQFYDEFNIIPRAVFGRDHNNIAIQLGMFLASGDTKYLNDFEQSMLNWFPNATTYSPWGLALPNTQNALKKAAFGSVFALIAAKHGIHAKDYINFAKSQIHYGLGDTGRSFVAGFGRFPPLRVHHRAASCPSISEPCGWPYRSSPDPNPHVVTGGVIRGPDVRDNYFDHRRNYQQNEAGVNGAGFHGALAGLKFFKDTSTL